MEKDIKFFNPVKIDNADVVAGYAFLGAWVGLILGFFGFVHESISANVSIGLALLGACVGIYVIKKK